MLEIGSLLDDKYKILSKIGHGGMSVVYMALNEKANKTWAVKEIRKDGKMDFNIVRQGLVAEIETLKRLNHPNLPSVIDVIEDEDTFIIVMDYIEGNSLDKAIAEKGIQAQEDVVNWSIQLCDVLGYLHSLDPPIIYRDMKPSNVMLKPDGNITLIDFGTAKTYEFNAGETTGIGTVGYAAPEQYINSGYGRTDARTDIYCLGMTMYHLLTGIDPCKHVISDRSIISVNSLYSQGLDEIIVKCTEQNPDDRYQNCEELRYDLEHHMEKGKLYKKKMARRVTAFCTTFLLMIISLCVMGVSFSGAQNKKSENYNELINKGDNPELEQNEREEIYLNAIGVDPTKEDAYLKLIDLFLRSDNDDETGALSREEAATILQIKTGLSRENAGGYIDNYYPLEELKANNFSGYSEVCSEIGFAYWYDYQVSSDRYSSAVEWFKEVDSDTDSIAPFFCKIGECKTEIKKYASQGRSEKKHDAYKTLWTDFNQLFEQSKQLEDNDIKILIYSEIVNTISTELGEFVSSSTEINKQTINTMLNNILSECNQLQSSTQFQDIQEQAEQIKADIKTAQDRANSVNE